MTSESGVYNSSDFDRRPPALGNIPDSIERRSVLQTIAGTAIVMATFEFSGALGTFNAPTPVDQISEIQTVNNVFSVDEDSTSEFDIRESYGLVRTVFGGTIGRTAEFYGVSRKTIYQWINSDTVPSLQSRQERRAKLVESAAKYVNTNLGDHSKEYTTIQTSNSSLVEILSAEEINLAELKACVDEIKTLIDSASAEEPSLADYLQRKGFTSPDGEDDLDPLIL